MILDALGPQAASIILTLVAALAAFAVAWGAIRVAYQRVTGAPVPRTRLTLVFDVLAELAVNVPGAANRSLAAGGARLFVSPEQEAIRAERDQLAARVAELTAAEEPGRLRPTVVPGEEPARSPDETTAAAATSRHRIAGTRGAV